MLSPRKINLLHKEKQNTARDSSKSPQKNSYENLYSLIINLLKYLQTSEISVPKEILKSLPSNLQHAFSGSPTRSKTSSPVKKQLDHRECMQTQTCLTKQINDLKFQLKRQEEDSASEIYSLKVGYSKESKKLKDQYAQLSSLYQKESRKLQEKVAQVRVFYEDQISQLKKHHQAQLIECTKTIQQQYSQEREEHKEELVRTEQKFEKEKEEIIQNFQIKKQEKQIEIRKIHEKHTSEKEQQKLKYLEKQQKLISLWQSRREAWQQEKKKLRLKHEEQKVSLTKAKEKLFTDLYLVRKQNSNLRQKISELKKQLKQADQILKEQQNKNNKQKNQFQQQLRRMEEKQKFSLELESKKYKEELVKKLKEHSLFLEEKEKVLRTMEELRASEVQGLRKVIKEMQERFESRQPRKQDMQKIEKCQRILVKKEIQMRDLKQNYQRMMLERENNQKNYNRIFSAHPSSRKHSSNQDFSSSHKIAKKSQTVDFSFILKALNKNT